MLPASTISADEGASRLTNDDLLDAASRNFDDAIDRLTKSAICLSEAVGDFDKSIASIKETIGDLHICKALVEEHIA